ncbi:hypothetical protein ACFL7M_10330 [Thermodesulfobacteriota bacterium]
MIIRKVIIINIFITVSLIWPTSGLTEGKNISPLIVAFQQGNLSLKAEEIPLARILDEIRKNCLVQISGLEARENEPITFSFKGELEEGIKRFLRHLGEKNYAFEFIKGDLRRVLILPEAKDNTSSISNRVNREGIQDKPLTAVRIQGIIDGSQAETLGLLEGDIIIEYDGIEIQTARQLISETRKRAHKEQIDMTVMRDNVLIPFVLRGGLIGIRIKTITNPL